MAADAWRTAMVMHPRAAPAPRMFHEFRDLGKEQLRKRIDAFQTAANREPLSERETVQMPAGNLLCRADLSHPNECLTSCSDTAVPHF